MLRHTEERLEQSPILRYNEIEPALLPFVGNTSRRKMNTALMQVPAGHGASRPGRPSVSLGFTISPYCIDMMSYTDVVHRHEGILLHQHLSPQNLHSIPTSVAACKIICNIYNCICCHDFGVYD
jgi:hypothetical protein